MKKKLSTIAIALSLTLSASPALATDARNPFSNLLDQLNQQINNVTSFIEEQVSAVSEGFNELLENAGTDLQAAIDGAIGQMGIPDLEKVRTEIEESVGAELNASDIGNEIDRQVTRAIASGTLSSEGQEQTLQKLQQTQASVQQVEQANQTAQTAVASQDVLKQIAAQNAQNAAILGTLQAETTQNAMRADIANTNLANISSSVDEQKAAQQKERSGAGLSTLRTTSFAGLF